MENRIMRYRKKCPTCSNTIYAYGIAHCHSCYHRFRRKSIQERFWKFVKKTPTCWEWQGALTTKTKRTLAYGRLSVGGDSSVTKLAHRVAWEIHRNPIPKGLCVLHKCDVPTCVNPAHLFIGTIADNVEDMVKKRRHRNCHGKIPTIHLASLTS